jgi:aspartyl-tRNA(Asn)/glutamyl-tRNA(Gln) amidotransferase subunit C
LTLVLTVKQRENYVSGHQNGIFSKNWTDQPVITPFSGLPAIVLLCLVMEVTDQLIDHLAHLSRLQFSDTEKQELKTDLQKMISFVEKLQEVDTTGIAPLTHMGSSDNALRDDEVKGMISREEVLLNAPVKDHRFFKVPKVINPQ